MASDVSRETWTGMFPERFAMAAFKAYSEAVGGRTHDGRVIPAWSDLSQSVRLGWDAAVIGIKAEEVHRG